MNASERTSIAPLVIGMLALIVVAGLAAVPVWHVLNELLTGHAPMGSTWLAAAIGLVVVVGLLGLAWTRFQRLLTHARERREQRAAHAQEGEEEAESEPVGTMFVLALYAILIVGMWGTVYWLLLAR